MSGDYDRTGWPYRTVKVRDWKVEHCVLQMPSGLQYVASYHSMDVNSIKRNLADVILLGGA